MEIEEGVDALLEISELPVAFLRAGIVEEVLADGEDFDGVLELGAYLMGGHG
jgi:hypothetical protein